MGEIVALVKEAPESSCPFKYVRIALEPERGPSPDLEPTIALILYLTAVGYKLHSLWYFVIETRLTHIPY